MKIMKKIFAIIICLVIFCNFSVTQAKQVRIADEGVETFYSSISNMLSQTKKEILLSNLLRTTNLDNSDLDLRAWSCAYYLEGYSDPIGEIAFFVNGQGYVFAAKVVSYYKQTEGLAGFIIATIFFAAGVSYDEIGVLLSNFKDVGDNMKTGNVWSQAKNRNFILMELPRMHTNDGIQCLIMASK